VSESSSNICHASLGHSLVQVDEGGLGLGREGGREGGKEGEECE